MFTYPWTAHGRRGIISVQSPNLLREVTMADEKRQGGTSNICHRSRVSLLDMHNQAQSLSCTPRPGLHAVYKAPAAHHKMELQLCGAVQRPRPGDRGHSADAMGPKNDTKIASRCTITTYARHQMEQAHLQAQRRQMVLPEVTKAGNRPPHSVSGSERQWPQDDTKFASDYGISVYARHQMEQPCSKDSTTQEPVWCPR